MNLNHYELLEIPNTASIDQIKQSYRRLAKKYHPDIAPDGTEIFKKINIAYTTLNDPSKRIEYDHTLKMGSVNISPNPSPQNYRPYTSRCFERLTPINATKCIWAVNIDYDELLQRKIITIENPSRPSKRIELQLDSNVQQGYKWTLKNQGFIGEDLTLVVNIICLDKKSSHHYATPDQPSNGKTEQESKNSSNYESSKKASNVDSLTIELLVKQSLFYFLYNNQQQLVSFSSDLIKSRFNLSLEDELVWHILLSEISKLTTSDRTNSTATSGKSQTKHPTAYSIDELKEAITSTLRTLPNCTCTKKSLCTKILITLGLVTRGKPRIRFEENVMEAVKNLIDDGDIEEYKAKNIRLRLIRFD